MMLHDSPRELIIITAIGWPGDGAEASRLSFDFSVVRLTYEMEDVR